MKKKMIIIALAVLALIVIAFAAVSMGKEDAQQVVVPATDAPATEPVQEEAVNEDAAAAQGEMEEETEAAEIFELGGEITEIADGYIVIEDSVHGMVQVNLGDDTLYDGADPDELAVGQFIQVMYDGKMTRSLPAQVYALKIGLYPVSGVVKELGENSVTLSREEIGDEVIVFLPEGAAELVVGDSVTAYTNGAMTMSLPAQTNAIGVVKH